MRPGPRGRWVAGVAAGLAAVVVVTLLQRSALESPPAAAPSPSAGTAPLPELVVPPPASLPPLPSTGTTTGPGFLDPVALWELFARTDTEVARIQPRLARVTRTAVPPLQSTGPVSFLVTADRALIRPLAFVPGFEVPDEAFDDRVFAGEVEDPLVVFEPAACLDYDDTGDAEPASRGLKIARHGPAVEDLVVLRRPGDTLRTAGIIEMNMRIDDLHRRAGCPGWRPCLTSSQNCSAEKLPSACSGSNLCTHLRTTMDGFA